MTNYESPVSPLTEDQCWNLLAGQQVGRLATISDGAPTIVPINYALDGQSIIFRTAEGNKLLSLTHHDNVCFEVDTWNDDYGMSVVVNGHASLVAADHELARMDKMPLRPWVGTIKPHYVRIEVDQMSGRRFEFGEEPRV